MNSSLKHRPSDGLDALGGEVTVLLQLLHDSLALLLAWNPSNDVCGLRYALGGVTWPSLVLPQNSRATLMRLSALALLAQCSSTSSMNG